jgi:broad specificity phosphatase PhoE
MTRLLVIRHGETDWNSGGVIMGWTPGIHLNSEGRTRVEALSKTLSQHEIAAVYSSPLERAVETAHIIAEAHAVPVGAEKALIEIDTKRWEGRRRADIYKNDPLWTEYHTNPATASIPGIETIHDVQKRAVECIERLRRDHSEQTFAVVTHGEVVRTVLAYYLGLDLNRIFRIIVDTPSVSVVEFHGDRPIVIRVNWRAEEGSLPLDSSFHE